MGRREEGGGWAFRVQRMVGNGAVGGISGGDCPVRCALQDNQRQAFATSSTAAKDTLSKQPLCANSLDSMAR